MLHLDLVKNYIAQVRLRGGEVLTKLATKLAVDVGDEQRYSTTLLSWAMYVDHSTVTAKYLQTVCAADLARCRHPVGEDVFRSESGRDFLAKRERYDAGLHVIARAWPELYALIAVIQPKFCPPLAEIAYESVSDPKCFGQIYFAMNRKDALGWAEIIAHEMGHQYLFVLFAAFHKRVKAPWHEEFFSEIRQTNRPLIGILHGTVAEGFMVQLGHKIVYGHNNDFTKDEIAGAHSLMKQQGARLLKDFVTVQRFDCLAIDESLKSLVAEAFSYAVEAQ